MNRTTLKGVRITMEEQETMVRVVNGREIHYQMVNGYWLPALEYLEPKQELHLNQWGRAHMRYLEEQEPLRRTNLATSGELPNYLTELQNQAENMMEGIVEHLIQQEGVTEELKRQDQMEWVRRMESIQNRAREVVMAEVICQ